MRREWRCTQCGRLLGVLADDERLHVRFTQEREYVVGLPAITKCGHCRTLNELQDKRRATPVSGPERGARRPASKAGAHARSTAGRSR
jgi:phage FluMu protein Com